MKEGDMVVAVVSERREVTGSRGRARGEQGLFLHGHRGRGGGVGTKAVGCSFRRWIDEVLSSQ